MWCRDRKVLKVSKSGLRVVSDGDLTPFKLPEPAWVPDKQSVSCKQCRVKFTFICRKHHCRRCGECFCGRCCKNSVVLSRMSFVDPVLQCAQCAPVSKAEDDFFNSELPILLKGGLLDVSLEESRPVASFCRLSASHRSLLLVPATPLDVQCIDLLDVEDIVGTTDSTGAFFSIRLFFHDAHQQPRHASISSSPCNNNHSQQLKWMSALHKSLMMIGQARQSGSCMGVEN